MPRGTPSCDTTFKDMLKPFQTVTYTFDIKPNQLITITIPRIAYYQSSSMFVGSSASISHLAYEATSNGCRMLERLGG